MENDLYADKDYQRMSFRKTLEMLGLLKWSKIYQQPTKLQTMDPNILSNSTMFLSEC